MTVWLDGLKAKGCFLFSQKLLARSGIFIARRPKPFGGGEREGGLERERERGRLSLRKREQTFNGSGMCWSGALHPPAAAVTKLPVRLRRRHPQQSPNTTFALTPPRATTISSTVSSVWVVRILRSTQFRLVAHRLCSARNGPAVP